MKIKQQLGKIYSLDLLGSLNLTDSIWMLLMLSRGFSLWQAGVAEGIFHLVSFLGEIPSGIFADLYGRKRAMCAGWLVFAAASLLMLFSRSFFWVCVSFGLNALGYNLLSGTREAITYDSLLDAGQEERYLGVCSWQNTLWRSGGAISRLLAGVAVRLGYRFCYGLHVATSLLGGALSATLQEPQTIAEAAAARSWRNLPAAFAQQVRVSVRFLRDTPPARALIFAMAGLGGGVTLVGFFLQQHLVTIGAGTPVALGPLLFVISLGGVVGARLAVLLGQVRTQWAVLGCGLTVALGCAACGSTAWPLVAAAGFAMTCGDELLCTVLESRLNTLLPSEQRATLVSVNSISFSIVMIILSPLLGLLCDRLGTGAAFVLTGASLALFTLPAVLLVCKNAGCTARTE